MNVSASVKLLAGALVAFGRQAAWRPGAFVVDSVTHTATGEFFG